MKEAVGELLGSSVGQQDFMYRSEIFTDDKGKINQPFSKSAAGFDDGRTYGEEMRVSNVALKTLLTAIQPGLYTQIRDEDTGAWYAIAPGIFWHIRSVAEANHLIWCKLMSPDQHVVSHSDIDLLRELIVRENSPVVPMPPPGTYKVAAGDTFTTIAAGLHVTVEQLKAANPAVTNIDNISVGQVLNVPEK
jgi:hypothetical protein